MAFGSSPRTWGTQILCRYSLSRRWFIPTDVGNSGRTLHPRLSLPVHPHGRGELSIMRMEYGPGTGSSPRTWGTQQQTQSCSENRRFIPTDVGNSQNGSFWKADIMVHPHGRGELATNLSCKLDTLGSSPRTWGTPSITVTQLCNGRFIPTDVGNSSPASRISSIPSVHPHGRGELIVPQSEHTIPSGSSPRTWGTREFIQHQAGNRRFIPTDVGNSYTTEEQGSEEPVHPHGRGELKDVVCGEWQYYGSSPRTWGTHRICGDSERSGRFIPTDVGNS